MSEDLPDGCEIRTLSFRGREFKIVCSQTYPNHPSWYSFDDEKDVRERWWDIKEGDVVVDAGTAYGSYSLTALAMGASKVFCWSPEFDEYDLLTASLEVNGWSRRSVTRRDGLWSRVGAVVPFSYARPTAFFDEIEDAQKEAAAYVKVASEQMPGAFPVSTLDRVVLHEHLPERVDWLKLDVEGAEVEVLKGGAKLIQKFRPKILVENHLFKDSGIKDQVHDYLLGLGLGYREVGTVPYHSISHSLYAVDDGPVKLVVDSSDLDIGRGVLSRGSFEVSSSKKRLAFVFDPWFIPIPIDPLTLYENERGLTGSEGSFFGYAREMKRRGHDVQIFASLEREGLFEEIPCFQYRIFEESRASEHWNAVLSWMHPKCLARVNSGTTKILNQQVNDFGYCPGWEGVVDLVTSPSHTHMNYLKTLTNFSKWEVLPNGVDESFHRPENSSPRLPEILWASSPDRGLHYLLEAFPEIKRRVPEVSLTICYRWDTMYASLKDIQPEQPVVGEISCRVRYIHEALQRLRDLGVTHRKNVSRKEMPGIMRRARVLGYTCVPVSFTEGFSVTTLEAAVSGCVPVIVGADALTEIYGDYVPTVSPPYQKHRQEYIDQICKMLSDDVAWRVAEERAQGLAEKYNWKVLGGRLEEILSAPCA